MGKIFPVLLLLWPMTLYAQTEKPPELSTYIHAQEPYGQGTLTKLGVHVYDATLWTDAKSWSMNTIFALELRYGTGFTSNALVSRSLEEMQRSADFPQVQTASYTQQLGAIFPDVNDGDIITTLYLPQKGVLFFYNGKPCGAIKDKAFAQRFLNIWLSPTTSEPKLRANLLP
jgi:hypothetical protein